MREFRKAGPNLIESGDDCVRIRGRAGLDVFFEGHPYDVSSELLFPPMSIALFASGGDAIPAERCSQGCSPWRDSSTSWMTPRRRRARRTPRLDLLGELSPDEELPVSWTDVESLRRTYGRRADPS